MREATMHSWTSHTDEADRASEALLTQSVRWGMGVLLATVCAALLWVAFVPVAGAIIAPGMVKVDANRKTVQHQEGGIVSQIHVREGQQVLEGQTLITLQDVQVAASVESLRTQLLSETAKRARLEAERVGAERLVFPPLLTARESGPRAREFMNRESDLFRTRRLSLQRELQAVEAQARELRAEVNVRQVQDVADERAGVLYREEMSANQKLVDVGYISKMRLANLERATLEHEARRGTNQAEAARARQLLASVEAKGISLRDEFRAQVDTELKDAVAATYELAERLRPSLDAEVRQRILAPVTGQVVDLKVSTVSAPIGPRERLMDIVPAQPELIVEARVRPEDIHYVKQGAVANVRLIAFKQRIVPNVAGDVVYVSNDRLMEPPPGSAYYLSHVRIAAATLQEAGVPELLAGMPAEVYLQTDERTVLSYLLDGLLGFRARAMREP